MDHKDLLKGHFVPSAGHKVFVTQIGPVTKTAILFLPSYAEEMNLSRAIVAKQARQFAQAGTSVMLMDYSGTGDSEGDFEDVDAVKWFEDVVNVAHWMQSKGVQKIILWGMRFGALLGMAHQSQLASRLPLGGQMYWKPVLKGKQFMSQFLRIKKASEMQHSDGQNIDWRAQILSGKTVEVAGYPLTVEMLASVDALAIANETAPVTPIAWLEIGATGMTPVIQKLTANWQSNHFKFDTLKAVSFWQVQEVFSLAEIHSPAQLHLDFLLGA